MISSSVMPERRDPVVIPNKERSRYSSQRYLLLKNRVRKPVESQEFLYQSTISLYAIASTLLEKTKKNLA
jgi:hypothetical protein